MVPYNVEVFIVGANRVQNYGNQQESERITLCIVYGFFPFYGMARTTVAAEEVGAREGPVAEAADAAAAAAVARIRLYLEKAKKSESASDIYILKKIFSCSTEIFKYDNFCES
jgi:hypothetical protein